MWTTLCILSLLNIVHSWVDVPIYARKEVVKHRLTIFSPLHGPLKAQEENAGNETDYKRFVAPAVYSRQTLFNTPMLPRDSIDRAVHSKMDVEDINDQQSLAGLERSVPTELRMGTTTGEDEGEIQDVVETVDTFRFTVSAADMERLSQGEIDIDAVKDSEDAGQRLLADRTFLEKLDGASYGYNEEGKKVVRVEMDLEELEDMLGYDTEDTHPTPSPREERQADKEMARAFSVDKMREAERQIERAVAVTTDMDGNRYSNGVLLGRGGEREEEKKEQAVPGMLESGINKPRWSFVGADVKAACGAMVGSAALVTLSALYIHTCEILGASILRTLQSYHAVLKRSKVLGWMMRCKGKARATPYVTLTTLLLYIAYHGVQHVRERRRFAGIGHAVPSQTFLERLLPDSSVDIF